GAGEVVEAAAVEGGDQDAAEPFGEAGERGALGALGQLVEFAHPLAGPGGDLGVGVGAVGDGGHGAAVQVDLGDREVLVFLVPAAVCDHEREGHFGDVLIVDRYEQVADVGALGVDERERVQAPGVGGQLQGGVGGACHGDAFVVDQECDVGVGGEGL